MLTIRNFRNHIPDTIYQRGLNYFQNKYIKDYHLTDQEGDGLAIKARVRGSSSYLVEINLQIIGKEIYFKGSCSCLYDWGDICKHQVAVLCKFIVHDYQAILEHYLVLNNYNKLVDYSGIRDNQLPTQLFYTVKGFMSDLVNFKLWIKSDTLSDEVINKIIRYTIESTVFRRQEQKLQIYFSEVEFAVIERLKELEKSKGRAENILLLPKSRENFLFLLDLIDNYTVCLEENQRQAEIGQLLVPGLVIKGDEQEIVIRNAVVDYPIYRDRFAQIAWSVTDSLISPVDLSATDHLPGPIKIPAGREGELLFEVIPALKEKWPQLELAPDLQEYQLIQYEPKIKLEFDFRENNVVCRANVEINGQNYRNTEILSIEPEERDYCRDENNPKIWYGRDNQPLKKLVKLLEDYGFLVRPDEFVIKDNGDIQEFITDGFIHIPEDWEVATTENFNGIEINTVELEPVITVDPGGGIDWFEFSITYNLGGKSYTRQEIQQMISYNAKGEPYIVIDNSYFILQHGEQEERISRMIKQAEQKETEDKYRSRFYNLLYYRELVREAGISFQGNKVYDQLEHDISQDNPVEEVAIPGEVRNKLRNYQKKGYFWLGFLDKYHFGGILADEMGLGKTVQVLTLLKSRPLEQPVLVVCPRTLIYNWAGEIEKFFPSTDYLVYYGIPDQRKGMRTSFGEYQLVITSYAVLSRDYLEFNREGIQFSYCVLDEAQHIKNYKTHRARAVKSIKAERRLALTGTPLENSVDELWSIFDFIMPGYLGNHSYFSQNYLNPIMKEEQLDKMEELKKRVAPFILRRKKREVLTELPDKITNTHLVEMTRLQEDTYRFVLEQVRSEIVKAVSEKGFNQVRINILAALTRLRQLCNHPALILGKEGIKQNSGKLDALLEIVEEAVGGGHKLLVFSQFVKMLKIIRNELEKRGILYEYLDGSIRDRMERVRNFNENQDIKSFLISLKAGGTGLNLTAADVVIHVDPWWNPMVESQATDRAHRLGQQNRVVVYRLITRGTVEEKMLKLQKKKQDIFDHLVEENDNLLQTITWEDIQELLEIT